MLKLLETPLPVAEEIEALEKLYRTTKDGRLRTHAWVDLLAGEQRMTAPVIAKIVREVTQMVRNWLKNWIAEDIEGLKVQQKVSSSFCSQAGAAAFYRIRGYLSTLCKQSVDLLAALEATLRGPPIPPSFETT